MRGEARRLRIAIVTALDARDRRSWSGTFYSIAQSLQKHCGEIFFIGPMHAYSEIFFGKLAHSGAHLLWQKNIAYRHSIAVSKRYARTALKRMAGQDFDVVVALSGATEIAFLQTEVPVVLVEDANFVVLREYHQQFSSLTEQSERELNEIQRRSLSRANLVFYATAWAAQAAIDHYQVDSNKIEVIPFGANLEREDVPLRSIVLAREPSKRCSLLFVGVNWFRKGGDIAFETLLALEGMGIEAKLTVCGCTPPESAVHPHMQVIPYLDKNDEAQRRKLEELYLDADFLLLPTRNECFGISFCEANAFGVPVITTSTGGVPEVVHDGENGFTLPYEARGEVYAERIASVYRDTALYKRLVQTSREAYETRLNWDNWGETANLAIRQLIEQKTTVRGMVSSF
jgi:glycosyltransferase involved in cell wall biosynthesis